MRKNIHRNAILQCVVDIACVDACYTNLWLLHLRLEVIYNLALNGANAIIYLLREFLRYRERADILLNERLQHLDINITHDIGSKVGCIRVQRLVCRLEQLELNLV